MQVRIFFQKKIKNLKKNVFKYTENIISLIHMNYWYHRKSKFWIIFSKTSNILGGYNVSDKLEPQQWLLLEIKF